MNVLNKNQEILLTIKRIGINGEGIGYYKRLAVFVPFAIPGEDVVISITDVNEKYARGVVKRVKQASPNRVDAKCPYFGTCGGCQIQHISYEEQLKFKKEIVMESFQKYYQGNLNPKVFKETVGMDEPWLYRNKVKRPVRYDGEKLVTGLYAFDTNMLVYIDKCFIEKEDIERGIKQICAYLTKHQVIAYNPKSRDGILRHIVIRSSNATKELQVTLILYRDDKRTIKIAKDLINIEGIVSVYISINDDLDAIESFGETTYLLVGQETIMEKLGDYEFNLLPTAFFQLNVNQTEKLYDLVAKVARLKGYEKLVDAYCGVGTIGLWLSKYVTEVRGIDTSKEAIVNAIGNAKRNGVENARFYSGDILTNLSKWAKDDFMPDVLVVDPPRQGMELRLINYLQDYPVKKIIYVSCNPATLAKNCNHLQKKYHILNIQPLDMFPNTSNVECVVCLERR